MKKLLLALSLVAAYSCATAQLNMTLLSNIQYPTSGNDIWGWVAPDGTEYAIMGLRNGVSIVSLADPTNAQEVAFIPGQNSTWRDIKTWGNYAYVTTDQNGTTEGLLVIDMSDLPNSAPYTNWRPMLPDMGTLNTCHNLYIDEFGYCYLSGCNLNSGGMLVVDVFTEPGNPIFVSAAPAVYSHDVYARNNIMYTSEIYLGRFGMYDVTDKNNIVLLGGQETPFNFTHNTWLSDDGTALFTTDERANAPIGSYDVSDPTNIVKLDEFRPLATLGEGVIPHNVHVWNDWLIISYYSDGGIIVDAARPDNLIEVGNFDTFLANGQGFNGAWGAYPFLPSGIVLVSDINSGLYVLGADYVRACYLEGIVTDAQTGAPIFEATIDIASDELNQSSSRLNGEYKTGLATAGTFSVTFSKVGYLPKTETVSFENGVLTILNVQLEPLVNYVLTGLVVSAADGSPVPNAQVSLANESVSFEVSTDENGTFSLSAFTGTYDIVAGAWGYLHEVVPGLLVNSNNSATITLAPGYQDDFFFDFNWTTSGTATAGLWERGVPVGTVFNGQLSNPDSDMPGDIGEAAYVTGNGGGGAGNDDVDNGTTILTSPVMDLSGYNDPVLSYHLWFFNAGGSGTPNDYTRVLLSNGETEIVLEELTASLSGWRPKSEFNLAGMIPLTDNMTITFITDDDDPGHLVEAAVDVFLVYDAMPVSTGVVQENGLQLQVSPNPFQGQCAVNYKIEEPVGTAQLHIINALGQTVDILSINGQEGRIEVGARLLPGLYALRLVAGGQHSTVARIVKTK